LRNENKALILKQAKVAKETGKSLTFLTNNMLVPATTVALLYKNRWHVELFFKWIKQHLRVKRFFGHSEICLDSELLRNSTDFEYHCFRAPPVFTLFAGENYTFHTCDNPKQLTLFDLWMGTNELVCDCWLFIET